MEEQKKVYEQVVKTVFGAKPQAENVNVNLGLEIAKSRNPEVMEQSSAESSSVASQPTIGETTISATETTAISRRYEQLWNRNLLKAEQP